MSKHIQSAMTTLCAQMPSYNWLATAGKKYSLLVIDMGRPGSPYSAFAHYFAYNVCNATEVTKTLNSTLGAWRPGNHRQLYVHLLFEHDADLAFDLSGMLQRTGSAVRTDLATFMAVTGLWNATLVSLNWMAVRSSILSSATIEADRCASRCHMRTLKQSVFAGRASACLKVQPKLLRNPPRDARSPGCARYVRCAHRCQLLCLPGFVPSDRLQQARGRGYHRVRRSSHPRVFDFRHHRR